MNEKLEAVYNVILNGDMAGTQDAVRSALDSGLDPGQILAEGMIAAMKQVGKCFEAGEYYVPEMLISARAMQAGLSVLQPHLVKSNVKSAGKVVIGTVKGDLHDIGKNLIKLMLEGAGFEVKDLGVDVPAEKFVEAISEEQPHIVALSALLTTTMLNMKTTVMTIQEAGLRDQVKIIIGGAPVTQVFADQIGADGYSPDAGRAASLAQSLLEV